MIDLPALRVLDESQTVMLLGAGGGYDILGAVPLFVALRGQGKTVHLGGVSFTSLAKLPRCSPEPGHSCLFAISADSATEAAYCPEAWLALWLRTTQAYEEPLWGISKTGVMPLRAALHYLADRLQNDTFVLVDGGVDLVLKGNETSIGTPAEDLASLQAVRGLEGFRRLIMCLGFGAELREGIPHAQVLERFAELQRAGAFLGATSLVSDSPVGRAYSEALAFIQKGQRAQRGTHIHRVVLAAMAGDFGPDGPDTWISPLASLCWFFSLPEVAESHLFAAQLEDTETIWDVTVAVRACRKDLRVRPRTEIPL